MRLVSFVIRLRSVIPRIGTDQYCSSRTASGRPLLVESTAANSRYPTARRLHRAPAHVCSSGAGPDGGGWSHGQPPTARLRCGGGPEVILTSVALVVPIVPVALVKPHTWTGLLGRGLTRTSWGLPPTNRRDDRSPRAQGDLVSGAQAVSWPADPTEFNPRDLPRRLRTRAGQGRPPWRRVPLHRPLPYGFSRDTQGALRQSAGRGTAGTTGSDPA